MLELLKKEVELCRLQADIGKQVEEKISKDQRRYFLMVRRRSCSAEGKSNWSLRGAVGERCSGRVVAACPWGAAIWRLPSTLFAVQ